MSNALIATLGNRDLVIKKEDLAKLFDASEIEPLFLPNGMLKARQGGAFLLQNFKKVAPLIKFGILAPCFNYFQERGICLDEIIWVVTDQPENVTERFRGADTVEFGRLASEWVRQFAFRGQNIPVQTHRVATDQVALLDEMHTYFRQAMPRKPFAQLNKHDRIFLLNQGGIDAINTALLLNLLTHCGQKLTQLAVSESDERCIPLRFTHEHLAEQERTKIWALLQNYDYAGIARLNSKPEINLIAKYADARLHFDFDNAKKCLHELEDCDSGFRKFVTEQLNDLNQVEKSDDGLIQEVYQNARIKFEQESYVDFLLRFFRITEYLVQRKAFELLELGDINFKKWESSIETRLDSKLELKNFLRTKKIEGQPLDYRKATIPVYTAILEYFKDPLFDLADQLRPLSQMRNKSIAAHDFKPVSRRLIDDELQKKGVSILDIFTKIEGQLGTNFQAFNSITDQIKRLAFPER